MTTNRWGSAVRQKDRAAKDRRTPEETNLPRSSVAASGAVRIVGSEVMNSNRTLWLVRAALLAVVVALLLLNLLGGYPTHAFPASTHPGDLAIITLILAGLAAVFYLLSRSRRH